MPSIKEFMEAMSSSWPVALAILLGSGAILAGDYFKLPQLAGFPSWSVGTAFVVAAFSGAILVVNMLRSIVSIITYPFRARRSALYRQEHLEGLNELPKEEIALLIWGVANQRQVVSVDFFDERVKALSAKGYLVLVPGNHHTTHVPYRIPNHIWDELKKIEFPVGVRESYLNQDPFGRRW